MLIAVVSDTHRIKSKLEIVKDMIQDADILIHLGDNVQDAEYLDKNFNGETYIVAGNCDIYTGYPKERVIKVKDKVIFMTHGDLYGVKSTLNRIVYKGKELAADVVLFGHTHMRGIKREDNMIIMNPGSPSQPRLLSGSIGFIEIGENGEIEGFLKEL